MNGSNEGNGPSSGNGQGYTSNGSSNGNGNGNGSSPSHSNGSSPYAPTGAYNEFGYPELKLLDRSQYSGPPPVYASEAELARVAQPLMIHGKDRQAERAILELAVPGDPGSFVRNYVVYGMHLTDAPLLYHAGVATSILASLAPPGLCLEGGGLAEFANFWCLLVGEAGGARKTHCIELGLDLLRNVWRDRLGPDPGSWEMFVDSLMIQGQQLVAYPEMGYYFTTTSDAGGYLKGLKNRMCSAFDSTSMDGRPTVGKIREAKAAAKEVGSNSSAEPSSSKPQDPRLVRQDLVRFSLLGGVSNGMLDQYSSLNDWEGGFLSRFLICYAKRAVSFPRGLPNWPKMREWLKYRLDELRRNWEHTSPTPCKGLTDNAQAMLNHWLEVDTEQEFNLREGDRMKSVFERRGTICLKAALLYAWDLGHARYDHDWWIGVDALKPAIWLTNGGLLSTRNLLKDLAISKTDREIKAVFAAIPKNGSHTRGEIGRKVRVHSKSVAECIQTLEEWGLIGQSWSTDLGMAVYFRLPDPGEPIVRPIPEKEFKPAPLQVSL